MRRVDPHDPGRRVAISRSAAEVGELAEAFNEMLDRLEAERQGSARRALAATEAERVRVARELHDQVGQTLTGVVLALEEIHRRAPADLGEDLAEVQEAARAGVEQVREIARGLRPGALEELGLRSALTTLANSFTGLRVRHSLPPDLPVLSPDQDLAVYRVAQESLTNVARHARAGAAQVELEEEDGAVVLRVSDDGVGIPELHAAATEGGVGGMRERALLAGGRLRVRALPDRGTEVRLDLWPSL
jgi:two-component system sensor histidine kinase UhpB